MKKLSYDDELVISECKELIAALITKYLGYKIPPMGIIGLSKALYAISNYPKKVIAGYIDITASTRGDCGMTYYSIYISSSEIKLSNGGSIYDEGVGSDSFSDLFYSTSETTPYDIEREIENWMDSFKINYSEGELFIEDEAELNDEEESEEEG